MKNYTGYTADAFASDDDFIRWVTSPASHPDLDAFWKKWVAAHPEQKEEIEEARMMIEAVLEEPQFVPGQDLQDRVWQRIRQTTQLPEPAGQSIGLWRHWYSKAAVVLVVLGLGWWISHRSRTFHMTNARIAKGTGVVLKTKKNDTSFPLTVELEDQSIVVLQPKSQLQYPEHFKNDVREVDLVGEAFFEVKKDPDKPFLVYTDEIVTRVLGTSFTVQNYPADVRVQVKTGRVTVLKDRGQKTPAQPNDALEGVILNPNQQVVYERQEKRMIKSLVESPSVLTPVAKQEFEFNDVSIADVFRAIKDAYGVEIVYDEQVLANCRLTASLTDVSLHNKLKLICKAINASYDIIDSHIVIYGKGCANP